MPPYPDDGLSIISGRRAVGRPCGSAAADRSPRLTGDGLERPVRLHDPATPPRRSTAFAQRAVDGRPGGPRPAARRRHDRIARLEQLGRRRHADRQRQAAPRQRPAPAARAAVDLVSRASVGRRRLRRHRRDPARHAGRRARPEPLHRVGRHQRGRRRRGSLSRAARRQRDDSPSSAARRSRCRSSRNDPRQGQASPFRLDVRITRHGPLVSDAINANNAAVAGGSRVPAARAAGVSLDRARCRRHDDAAFLKVNEARNWNDFTAALRDFVVPSQNFVYADVDGHIGYYAPGRIPIRAQRRRLAAGRRLERRRSSGPAGFPSTSCRTSTIRPNTSSSRPTTGRRPPTIRTCSGSSGRNRIARSGFAICSAGQSEADARRFRERSRPTRSRCTRRALLPLLLQHVQPADGCRPAGAATSCGGGTATCAGEQRGAAIFEAWFLRLTPTIVGDDLGPLATAELRGPIQLRHAVPRATRSTRNDLAWCDDRSTREARDLR